MNNKEIVQQAIDEGNILWEQCVEIQNAILSKEDALRRDDKRIWDPFLHTWSNEDWVKILLALKDADNKHGLMGTELDHIEKVQNILMDYMDIYDRVMDKRDRKMDNKSTAWKAVMIMREIYNRINKINLKSDLRISHKSDSVKNYKQSTYNSLFSQND